MQTCSMSAVWRGTPRMWGGPWTEKSWGMRGEEGPSQSPVSEGREISWPAGSLPHVLAASTLTWGLQFSIDEGEQLLADAAVRNGPGQESVVGSRRLQKEVWVWREVWRLGWRGSSRQERSRWEKVHWYSRADLASVWNAPQRARLSWQQCVPGRRWAELKVTHKKWVADGWVRWCPRMSLWQGPGFHQT